MALRYNMLHHDQLIIAPTNERLVLRKNLVPDRTSQNAYQKEGQANNDQLSALKMDVFHQED